MAIRLRNLKFIQVNKAAIEHYGYTEAEFLTMVLTDIQALNEVFTIDEIIINKNKIVDSTVTGSFNHIKKNRDIITVEVHNTDIMVKHKKCKSVIAVDVTERNLYEYKITKAIIKTQEEERYEIGGELHDNVCQILATSMISLGMMKKYIEPAAEQWYKNTKGYIRRASNEIRNLSHRLASAFFDDSNFEVAIEILLNTFNAAEEYEIALQFDNKISEEDLTLEIQLNLYRIVQEKFRNIMKYAKSTKISPDFFIENDMLVLKITDNGI